MNNKDLMVGDLVYRKRDKKTAIVYKQHQEVARIPVNKIEYIYYLAKELRVDTSIPRQNGYPITSYKGDEIEFVSE